MTERLSERSLKPSSGYAPGDLSADASGPSRALLDCRNLNSGYGSSQVLFGVSLQIQPQEVVTLLGRNGMGKSTTIKAIVGALSPRGGSIAFDGHSLHGMAEDAIARQGIAIVPEGRQCFPNLSVREHLVAFARPGVTGAGPTRAADSGWDLERIYDLFPRLKERQHHMGNQLSGGEQQMLAIGRALSTNPRLLILDEATEGLAPVIREEIWKCLSALKAAGQTILVVDKYVHRLMELADRHVIVERGRVVWSGDSQALAGNQQLWSDYLGV